MALKDFAPEMDRCSSCSYCKWIPFDQMKSWRFAKNCPSVAYHNFNSHSARGRYLVARSLLNQQSEITDTVRRVVYSCLTCGSCDVSCKVCRYNLEPLEMVRELKFHLVNNGQNLAEHIAIIDSLNRDGNTLGAPRGERGAWADGLEVKRFPGSQAEVIFHAGCRISYDEELQKNARAAVKILTAAGVDLGIMGDHEMCCGGRIYNMGYKEEFNRFARANISAWKRAGVKLIVTSCSDGYHAIKRLYPQLGSEIEVLHTLEYIDRLLKEGQLKFQKEIPLLVSYHDPCHLGRQGEPYVPWEGVQKKVKGQVIVYDPKKPRYNGAWGIYDPPRDILKSIPGIELVEMERIREYSWCCGAGGGVREAYPEFSQWTASERLTEARSTGAEALITACPWCERNFLDAVKAQKDTLRIMDIIELVQQAL